MPRDLVRVLAVAYCTLLTTGLICSGEDAAPGTQEQVGPLSRTWHAAPLSARGSRTGTISYCLCPRYAKGPCEFVIPGSTLCRQTIVSDNELRFPKRPSLPLH